MKVTIHQPDFLPWIGLFNKIANADCWVVLDHVTNNPRDAAFWGRRVKILVNEQPLWLSIPLSRPAEPGVVGIPIREMAISSTDPKVMEKCLRTIRNSYSRAPFFSDYFPLAESYFSSPEANLVSRNMDFIVKVMDLLKIRTKVVFSSTFGFQSKGTQLLVDLVSEMGGNVYLCGGGAGGYQEDDLFMRGGIALEYNRFEHPVYRQFRSSCFVPGLSILDALFSVGEEEVAQWVAKR